MTLFGALWVEVTGQPATSPDPIVWRDDFPVSYGFVTSEVGAGFSTSPAPLAKDAADRCFLAAWRWERAGAHHVLSEGEGHALWELELVAIEHVLEAAEVYAAPSRFAIDPGAQAFAEASAASHVPPLTAPPASIPSAAALAVATAELLGSGAPQYLIDFGVAVYGRLDAVRAGTATNALTPSDPSAPLAERVERQLARPDLASDLRARLKAIRVTSEPAAFVADYYRSVLRRESDDLLLRGRTWGELETEFRASIEALKEVLQ